MKTSEAAGRLPLPIELHAATRNEHALLNRTIIARLPLCLPNATSSTALYAQGIAVFAQIYYGIEDSWDGLLLRDNLSHGQRYIVEQLNITQLRRTKRLRYSIEQMSKGLNIQDNARLSALQCATNHFREDIIRSILAKPHLLMAYTWTMYLALFNGGRWIAKQLLNAGTVFWNQEDRAAIVQGPLTFWFFGEDEDYNGEDLKIAFKDRFNDTADALTDIERDEIIAESKRLFQICADMVEFLDEHAQAPARDSELSMKSTTELKVPLSDRTNALDYLAAAIPAPIVGWLRNIVSNISSTQNVLPVPLRQEIDQNQG